MRRLPCCFALTVICDATHLAILLLNILVSQAAYPCSETFMSVGIAFCFFTSFCEIALFAMIAAVTLQPCRVEGEHVGCFSSLDFSRVLIWWIVLCLLAVLPWEYPARRQNSVQLQSESSLPD